MAVQMPVAGSKADKGDEKNVLEDIKYEQSKPNHNIIFFRHGLPVFCCFKSLTCGCLLK